MNEIKSAQETPLREGEDPTVTDKQEEAWSVLWWQIRGGGIGVGLFGGSVYTGYYTNVSVLALSAPQ